MERHTQSVSLHVGSGFSKCDILLMMLFRPTPLVTGEIYHLFNRGHNKQDLYFSPRDYRRFIDSISYYHFQGPKPKFSKFIHGTLIPIKLTDENALVDVFCYCLMPNHFHLLVRQRVNGGITKFMSQLANSWAKYSNLKYGRSGSPFEGHFRSVLIENDEQFIHVSRYIHINPIVSKIAQHLEDYPWSSYCEYMSGKNLICTTADILSMFSNSTEKYKKFLNDQISYGETLEKIKHQQTDIDE